MMHFIVFMVQPQELAQMIIEALHSFSITHIVLEYIDLEDSNCYFDLDPY